MEKQIDILAFENYINREISSIEFNSRVLCEAEDKSHPLLERLKFVIILSTNLDEFFMIRVAGLKSQVAANVNELSYDGKSPAEQLAEIYQKLLPLYAKQEKIWTEEIIPELAKYGILQLRFPELDEENKQILEKYFLENVFPILTPLMLGPANPFPRLTNRSVNIAFVLRDKNGEKHEQKIGILQIPTAVQRIVKLKKDKLAYPFILIEHVIIAFAALLYPGYEIEFANTFRVTRDADFEVAEDEAEDLLYEIKEQILLRSWGKAAVRLEVNAKMPDFLAEILKNSLNLQTEDVYWHNRAMNLRDFMFFAQLDFTKLKVKPFLACKLPEFEAENAFEAIKKNDILVRHPFDSFTNSVVKFINQAADDANVIAIKITLYRAGTNSPIITALKRAAHNGKYVTAFVELKARFDEENNIVWAKELEATGVHVVYGVPGLKTHCKLLMIVRRENEKLKTYLHMSTGNYNQTTARLYTDVGFFTADDDFAHDAVFLFNFLTGYSQHSDWRYFSVAPSKLKSDIIDKIRREADLSTPENPGLVFAKLNSIAHREIIQELYKASQKGVQIRLICRGICCLRPGVPGVSENIEVRSILGRFLEHDRIFYFSAGEQADKFVISGKSQSLAGVFDLKSKLAAQASYLSSQKSEIFLSSADWMTRNLQRRVEIMFPIRDEKLKAKLYSILEMCWRDNTKSWKLLPDGTYEKIQVKRGTHKFSVQEECLKKIANINN